MTRHIHMPFNQVLNLGVSVKLLSFDSDWADLLGKYLHMPSFVQWLIWEILLIYMSLSGCFDFQAVLCSASELISSCCRSVGIWRCWVSLSGIEVIEQTN